MDFNFTNPGFIITGATGLCYLLASLAMKYMPPKKRNHLYGYRTRRSMRNEASWNFAQAYSTKWMMKSAVACIISAVIFALIPKLGEHLILFLSLVTVIIFTGIPIYMTEQKLKNISEVN